MTPTHYMAKIAPIGILYSGSLVCSNTAYMYLNVGFIQMLKVRLPTSNHCTIPHLLIWFYTYRHPAPS